MRPINDSYLLSSIPAPPGVSVWPKFVGKLTSQTGIHYDLGGYVCPHIIEKGRGVVIVDGKTKEIGPGDMFCIMSGGRIEYRDDPKNPWSYYWIHLEGADADAIVESWGFTTEIPWLRPNDPDGVLESFKRIHEMSASEIQPRPNALAAEIFKLSDAVHMPESQIRTGSGELVGKAVEIIEAQLHTGLNVAELAALLKVERTTLFHAFRNERGCSPIEYIRLRRMERVCSLLKRKDRTLSEIARICGFSSDKYLIKTFNQLKGSTPSKWLASQ